MGTLQSKIKSTIERGNSFSSTSNTDKTIANLIPGKAFASLCGKRSHSSTNLRGTESCGSHSSATQYSEKLDWIDGRPHKKLTDEGVYSVLPVDDETLEHDTTHHHIYKYVLHGNHLAVLDNPRRILDAGTGGGTWICEMAKDFPKAKVIGIDIQDQVDRSKLPPNAQFQQVDLLAPEGLPYKDGYFDYVYMRDIRFFFTDAQWSKVIQELFRVTKPGGQIELLEADLVFNKPTPETEKLMDICVQVMRQGNIEPTMVMRLDKLLKTAGFVDIQQRVVPLPMGEQGGVPGRLMANSFKHYTEYFRSFIGLVPSLTEEEYSRIATYCIENFNDLEPQLPLYIYVARRPAAKNRPGP